MNLGWLLALLVLLGAFILVLTSRLDIWAGLLFAGLALGILLASVALPWRSAPP